VRKAPQALCSMARLTSRSFAGGTLSVTTWPMPIITYQLTTSTPAGGNFFQKPVWSRCLPMSASVLL